jgi:hypothetical protein
MIWIFQTLASICAVSWGIVFAFIAGALAILAIAFVVRMVYEVVGVIRQFMNWRWPG